MHMGLHLPARLNNFLLFLLLAGLSCHKAGPASSIRCKRIVSLLPSATETLFAIGAGHMVRAVTRFDNVPAAVKKLPKVGGIIDASPEAILAQSPDCVVGTAGILTALRNRLKDVRAQGVAVDYSDLRDVFRSIRLLGQVTGHENVAVGLVRRLKQGIVRIRKQAKFARRHPRVLFVTSLHPMYVAGPDSFIGTMLDIVGANNCVKRGKFPMWSMEEVIASNPDRVILFQDPCAKVPDEVKKWPVRCAKNGNIVSICDESLVRPGPRLIHALKVLYDLVQSRD